MRRTKTHTQRWSFDIDREPADDWPERRPMPYSRVNREYRPETIVVSFASKDGSEPKLDGLTVWGRIWLKDGTPGTKTTDERFYTFQMDKLPDWLAAIARECRESIGA